MRAVVLQEDRTVKVEERPKPSIAPNQILIKNITFGQNPSDWKHATYLSTPGVIMGCDSIGIVIEKGSVVPMGIDLGERRGVFMHGGTSFTNGAFADFVAIDHDLTFRVPFNLSNEESATIPACFFTAPHILYLRMGLPEPFSSESGSSRPWLLLWSGASSVGQFVIQLAKLSGCQIITTASKANWDHLKSLGADVCLDYRDPDIVNKVKAQTSDELQYAVDCYGDYGSLHIVHDCLSAHLSSHLVSVLPLPPLDTFPPNPKVVIESTVLYTALGTDIQLGPFLYKTQSADKEHHLRWLRDGPKLFEENQIKPLKIRIMGGLDNMQNGFELMREGIISAEKLVYICDQ